ncbi:CENP-B protein, partial [Choiromyces venosus 120613-1]
KEMITMIETISAERSVLPPMIIYKGQAHYKGWTTLIEEKEDAFFATSPKGYTNTDITFQWFQEVFEPRTRPMNGINQHRILVLDGHSTHVENYEFVKYAINHNIHLLCLPSHSTHVLQPLDVGIFSLLTTYYKQELE